MLNVLDLFSGVGGFSLGLERTGGFATTQFVEQDEACRRVLQKHWPDVPVHDDVTTFEPLCRYDVICGASPAPTSVWQAREQACRESAQGSGSSTCASSTTYARRGSSSKTWRLLGPVDSISYFPASQRSGITLDGIAFQAPPLVPLIKEIEFGLLPTPRASEWKGCGPKGSKSHDHWISHFYLTAMVTDSGKLSPTFAEDFMGFPPDWTDV